MKKNVMMRVASIMLVLVLLTSSVISGTFAKYVTSDSAHDQARVAKFGVTVTAEDNTMFGAAYVSADGTVSTSYNAATDSVNAFNGTDYVVAPGTNGDLTNIYIEGQPEVDVAVAYVGTVDLSGWTVDGAFYCPLRFVIKDRDNNVKATIDGATYTEETVLEAAIATYINNFSAEYEANTDLADEDNCSLYMTWEWPFYVSDDNDVKDTALGDAAADGNAATIEIDITCTVTQID